MRIMNIYFCDYQMMNSLICHSRWLPPGNILHALAAPHRIARPSDVLGFRDVAAVMELLRAREGDFLMKALMERCIYYIGVLTAEHKKTPLLGVILGG